MDAGFFVIALIGIIMVIHWSVVNDRAGNNGVTTGFFAMREPEEPGSEPQPGAASERRRTGRPKSASRQRRC